LEEAFMDNEVNGSSRPGKLRGMLFRVAVLFAILLFLPFPIAGTLDWPGAWADGAIMILFFIVSRVLAWRKNPGLLEERGRFLKNEEVKPWDKVLSIIVGLVGYFGILVVAALDRRFSWSSNVSWLVILSGFCLVALGNALASWAFLSNRFFSGVVRIQKERGHVVVDSGPYRIVRHPGYLGGIISDIGSVFLLGSYWALIPAALTIAAMGIRTYLEDMTLMKELSGYPEFSEKTRFRLIPGIW
jgi:protein-S-isoprenylcysteine O-methyltransferase Ste14